MKPLPDEFVGQHIELYDPNDDYIIPTKEELDAHIAANAPAPQGNGYENTCEKCIKFAKRGPNMGYCKVMGVMVLKFQMRCEDWTPNKQSNWG